MLSSFVAGVSPASNAEVAVSQTNVDRQSRRLQSIRLTSIVRQFSFSPDLPLMIRPHLRRRAPRDDVQCDARAMLVRPRSGPAHMALRIQAWLRRMPCLPLAGPAYVWCSPPALCVSHAARLRVSRAPLTLAPRGTHPIEHSQLTSHQRRCKHFVCLFNPPQGRSGRCLGLLQHGDNVVPYESLLRQGWPTRRAEAWALPRIGHAVLSSSKVRLLAHHTIVRRDICMALCTLVSSPCMLVSRGDSHAQPAESSHCIHSTLLVSLEPFIVAIILTTTA